MESVPQQIKSLLDSNNCDYEMFEHEPVRTSEDAAKTRPGITLHQGTKALVCDAKFESGEIRKVMIVLPADLKANLKAVRKFINCRDLCLASPSDVLECTGVEIGGVPPFGQNLFGIKTFVDNGLFENEKIAFNAGSRSVSVIMKSSDYGRIAKFTRGDFSRSSKT